ncbi:bifunctional 4-hydroxy-2-oxoglutarate aldolase/2-dehydro-3-deoxy-phosphogluconate aldolase [Halobacillus salinarum]|uniref:Bifunctional 4-hydroxy-2-oxoglutarate aldolase/2-dehydro-3-deoxy-phosphogluconate aldolase n=1 Tax=Halobacillus salinarum TaxID=2932257 RepID=A0ABY4EKS6_9BACI|nr:bifunctional 4-hydroxy-2-oxoglutarate aldolase/2-dehydro-3-deoxy-phosphogluconate aldolase [Halobacillus salinarum]UOQ45070.1 bifunctional 4-hydroxy-2-oxoglutarate aldolase/2-dehydro-3-deoxy-phosphogluconate aldolase [Halobacillus salinarum]
MEKASKLLQLEQSGVVAVIRKPRPEDILPLVDALVEGGVKTLELTVDTEQAFTQMRKAKERLGKDVLVGAGTVLDAETARTAIQAGAEFVFSPNYNEDLIQMANSYGVISIPGVMTPSEIVEAYKLGADVVKIFPASIGGPSYIKDLQGPLGHIPMIPTGGVTAENAGDFIKNGATAVGAGGSLVNKRLLEQQDFAGITTLAKQFTANVKMAREEQQS